ncbi:MAG: NDP-sugar synthase [Dehalococcoidia bacterium]|nr:NDP-sugar synthase [Dehalococcoidia bacterium]MCA9850729.1 NDP-sugar synthase [Dehalococcoidia bacterium]MCA9857443.1 NDP-sugar synthase [Dehalococcoidia bacterium]MCB9483229.1 NDP-sugar synthase [Dehalococcoidia bacterium]MCB9492336.1 NDP-sugar synthase [Dehalococcoidia bacterium]
MRAIVLVGGEGTRLRPLTWRTPKALVPILGRPLLEHLLLNLKQHGVTSVTLAMTARNEAIRGAFGDGQTLGIDLDYAYEDTPLGSGGAIGSIASTWRAADGGPWAEPFLVVNGDVISDLDVSAMIANHRAKHAVLSLSLHEVEDPSPFGVVDIDADGRIHRFVEKPKAEEAPSRLINAGTWVFDARLIGMLDPTTFNRVEDGLFPRLCADGEPVYGFHQSAYWADVGNPDALLRVNLDMARGAVASPAARAGAAGYEQGIYVDETSTIEDGANIEAPSVIGADCVVRAGSTVSGSLLWDGVTVGAAAEVRDTILATGVSVGDGARLERSVVAHHATIQPNASLQGERIDPAEAGQTDPSQAPARSGTPSSSGTP